MPTRMSPAQRDRFLAGRHIAVLITNGADGHPVPTPIWYLYRDGAFYFRTEQGAIKTQNILRDPKVSVCVQEERAPYKAVIAYGTAEVKETRLARGDPAPLPRPRRRRRLRTHGAARDRAGAGGRARPAAGAFHHVRLRRRHTAGRAALAPRQARAAALAVNAAAAAGCATIRVLEAP